MSRLVKLARGDWMVAGGSGLLAGWLPGLAFAGQGDCAPAGRWFSASGSEGLGSASNQQGDIDFDAEGYHRPVLVDEVVAALQPSLDSVFFDGTAVVVVIPKSS